MTAPLLKVVDLQKHFPVRRGWRGWFGLTSGHVQAVDGISFEIPRARTVAMVGESGCGKTTAARSILRLVEPDGGQVWFRGQDLLTLDARAMRAMRPHLQIIFQDPFSSLNPRQTVGQIIGNGLLRHGKARGPAEAEEQSKAILEKVGLQPSFTSRYPHEFSGGQRQRIGIARAVALEPELIVCDEAVSALDVSVRAQVLNLLLDLQREKSLSYLFVTHDLGVVRHIADHVLVMYLGEIVEQAPRAALFDHPSHPYTRALLSAAPVAVPGRRRQRILLQGDVPSPLDPPPGCRFHTRCPEAMPRCRVEAPPRVQLGPGHEVRCHLFEGAPEVAPSAAEQAPGPAGEQAAVDPGQGG